jgi:hypothetical protein
MLSTTSIHAELLGPPRRPFPDTLMAQPLEPLAPLRVRHSRRHPIAGRQFLQTRRPAFPRHAQPSYWSMTGRLAGVAVTGLWIRRNSLGVPFAWVRRRIRQWIIFSMSATKGWPSANLHFRCTSTPEIGGCATFSDSYWQRWQAEPGVWACGNVTPARKTALFEAAGYHEGVRGCWAWPQLDGWVFGFCNHAPRHGEAAPDWSIVFALLQPEGGSPGHTWVAMVWRRGGWSA